MGSSRHNASRGQGYGSSRGRARGRNEERLGWTEDQWSESLTDPKHLEAQEGVRNYIDFKENYLPLADSYLARTEATPQRILEARGKVNADAQIASGSYDTDLFSDTAGRGGSRAMAARRLSSGYADMASDAGAGEAQAQFSKRRAELGGRLKIAALGRDLENTNQVAAQNRLTSTTAENIAKRRSKDSLTSYLSEGAGQVIGMATAARRFRESGTGSKE